MLAVPTPEPEEFTIVDPDGWKAVAFRWVPDHEPRAALHILHGLGEHALRYDATARHLVAAGYVVYADDHRGHGQSGLRNDGLGRFGPRGMAGIVDAAHAVTSRIIEDYPGTPVFALGHSWGSFILTQYIRRYGYELVGAILTGTTYLGGDGEVATNFNSRFEPARTSYDWLSRDPDEVDAYIADPLCGFEAVVGASGEIPPLIGDESGRIPKDLPVAIFNGGDDPIGGAVGGARLVAFLRDQGLADVTLRVYDGARHELFNETNRDEVRADVIAWIDAHIPAVP